MSPIVVYGTKRGHAQRVASSFLYPSFNLAKKPELTDVIIWVCPTYGDEEMLPKMEDYILSLTVRDKKYAICELGTYYGYENKEFGSAPILRHCLTKLGWREFAPSLSLDTLPIDWDNLHLWQDKIAKLLKTSNH